jgi:hypothetical protein
LPFWSSKAYCFLLPSQVPFALLATFDVYLNSSPSPPVHVLQFAVDLVDQGNTMAAAAAAPGIGASASMISMTGGKNNHSLTVAAPAAAFSSSTAFSGPAPAYVSEAAPVSYDARH